MLFNKNIKVYTFSLNKMNFDIIYDELLILMDECDKASNIFYEDILNHPKMKDKVIIYPKNKDIWNFNIEFIRPLGCVHKIYGMSISYPYNLLGEKCDEDFPSTIKTTLLGLIPINSNKDEADIISSDNNIYLNVSYFPRNDLNSLIEDILRISNYLSKELN